MAKALVQPQVRAPKHLSKSAKTLWREIVEAYELDGAMLAALQLGLEARDMWDEARMQLQRDGLTVTCGTGGLKPHPALSIAKQASSTFLQAWRLMGLHMDSEVSK